MRNMPALYALLAVGVFLVGVGEPSAREGWEDLFDGKSSAGWTQRGGKADYTVEDGAIVGSTVPNTPNSFLCTLREFGDFILELEFKVDPGLNSGVQIRSESREDYQNGRVHGYQVEIDPSERAWTGGIYDEGRRGWLQDLKDKPEAQKAIRQNEWNRFRIEAMGPNIRTWLNGVPVADLVDAMTPKGFIALQVHAGKSENPLRVSWRNIRILDLEDRMNDPFMGDWSGTMNRDGKQIVCQVAANEGGVYRARLFPEFDVKTTPIDVMEGNIIEGKAIFSGTTYSGEIKGGVFTGSKKDDVVDSFVMKSTVRSSPNLGATPPEGAIVLFDGTNLDQWQKQNGEPAAWKLIDGAMEIVPGSGSIITKAKFADIQVHVEFRIPFQYDLQGQRRGNSGVYLQDRYEIQVLDSYGLEEESHECGGIYGIAAPQVNVCYPPLAWQTYDIVYRSPRFDDAGNKTENARATVRHNGVTIHDNVEIPHATGSSEPEGDPKVPMGLHLQDHGCPVQYRNVWLVDLAGA